MIIYSFVGFLFAMIAGSLALHFVFTLRSLRVASAPVPRTDLEGRYRPMLRLLADDDLALASGNPALARKLRAQRRQFFRGYLRCLTRDYARLLEGLRIAMVESHVDRPDLAKALAANRVRFALAICRIELRLALRATVDVAGLVEAVETLRVQTAALAPVAFPAAA